MQIKDPKTIDRSEILPHLKKWLSDSSTLMFRRLHVFIIFMMSMFLIEYSLQRLSEILLDDKYFINSIFNIPIEALSVPFLFLVCLSSDKQEPLLSFLSSCASSIKESIRVLIFPIVIFMLIAAFILYYRIFLNPDAFSSNSQGSYRFLLVGGFTLDCLAFTGTAISLIMIKGLSLPDSWHLTIKGVTRNLVIYFAWALIIFYSHPISIFVIPFLFCFTYVMSKDIFFDEGIGRKQRVHIHSPAMSGT